MDHIVYVIDDDKPVRQSIVNLLRPENHHAPDFASVPSFLAPCPRLRHHRH